MTRARIWAVAALGVIWPLWGGISGAVAESLPEFGQCIATEIAYFERDHGVMPETGDVPAFDGGNFDLVYYCGTIGIMRCDEVPEKLACQRRLRIEQDIMRARVLSALPEPSSVAGRGGTVSDALYPQVWALAHGHSAGPDCAGSPEVMEVWCETREANGRLNLAIQAWQVARYLRAAKPAVLAGWAGPPPPLRPRLRPERGQ